ncbi:MAG: diguanylate cyclase domain-containing protein [Acinetobacter radioresistens]
MRAEVQQAHLKLENVNSISVSVSIGVATGAENWLELLEKADQALFRAKAAGRNSVA